MQKDHFRAFFAFDLPKSVKKTIASWKQPATVKWMKPEKLHLTLCFLGNITSEQYLAIDERIRAALVSVRSFSIKLTDLKPFPSEKKPRVLALIPEPQESIKAIVHIIDQEVIASGVRLEKRPCKPHITLGYVGRRLNHKTIMSENMSFKVSAVKLFKSEAHPGGSVYTPVAIYKLKM